MAARTLMIQGTASHVGKSVFTAALCRLFHRRGVRVAPFKAQNMSNNSFVTPDGREIGRAQAVQAAASRLPPRTDFNPILIKPSADCEAQLIVDGVVVGPLSAKDFGLIRRQYWSHVERAFTRLEQEFDIVVLEGAGSPAEVNLRDCDVVNMQMARRAKAPVLLLGDIDRGGVFASLVGTWMLLDSDDRRHLRAFAINKFRGEPQLLTSGLARVSHETGMICAGVIPHWGHMEIHEEDVLGWDSWHRPHVAREDRVVIGIVNVPAISNCTDFEPLAREPDVELVQLDHMTDRTLDALIFPGSKHTVNALQFVRAQGFDRLAQRVVAEGGVVGGICSGYQLLGKTIHDPNRVESDEVVVAGLGMLPVDTFFAFPKIVQHLSGRHVESGERLTGYHVRMGRTIVDGAAQPFMECPDSKQLDDTDRGMSIHGGRVFGTYLHGLFEQEAFCRWWVNQLRVVKGWTGLQAQHTVSLDGRLDQLADFVEQHLSMALIDQLVEEGVSC